MDENRLNCSSCTKKDCGLCEKILLKVIGEGESAKKLYDTVLAVLDKVDVSASVVLLPMQDVYKEFVPPLLVKDNDVLFSSRVPSVIEVVAMVLMLGH